MATYETDPPKPQIFVAAIKVRKNGIYFHPEKNFGIIAQIILPILIFGGIAILFSRMNQGPGNNMMNNAMNIGKSKAKV